MVLAARRLPKAFDLRPTFASLAAMGVGALVLQQFADLAVGTFLRGMTPAQQFAHLTTPAGLIYVALLIAFVAIPALANWPQGQGGDPRPLSASLRAIKAIHTLIWAFFGSCIVAIPILAWLGRFGGMIVLAVLVSIEIVVLIMTQWRCPLTNMAANYTDDRSDNFDIYLPVWLARHNKSIFGWLFAAGLAFALAAWLKLISHGT
jgi:hypothetical protein